MRLTANGTEQITVPLPAGKTALVADLTLPGRAAGLVIFAHGSGSSRHSPRNRLVAQLLNQARIGTVLIDLLTEEEGIEDELTAQLRFNIHLLGSRLMGVSDWIVRQPRLSGLGLGYFGASTGAAAALVAAAERPDTIRAVVSRGGRPDLAGAALWRVHAPALFIVGGEDEVVLRLNRAAIAALPAETERKLAIIAGATHLFEEPGALNQVADLAIDWFENRLGPAA